MKIIMIPLHEIIPYENNPRDNTGAIEGVAKSIKEFGFKVPIVLDKNKQIIAGHTRMLAATLLGMTKAPCILADDLTDDQVKAFRLADNKTAEMAGWDFPLLEEELAGLSFDMAEFGFIDHGQENLDDLLMGHEGKPKEPKMVTCPHCGESFEA